MEVIQYDKPTDRVRAFIRAYAQELYGIPEQHAEALAPCVEIAFDPTARASDRIAAARELAKYSEVPTRSLEYESGKNGPDLEVLVQGAIEIGPNGKPITDTKRLAPATPPSAPVELLDAGRDESSISVAPEGGEGLDSP